jgi:hypothetical protein
MLIARSVGICAKWNTYLVWVSKRHVIDQPVLYLTGFGTKPHGAHRAGRFRRSRLTSVIFDGELVAVASSSMAGGSIRRKPPRAPLRDAAAASVSEISLHRLLSLESPRGAV